MREFNHENTAMVYLSSIKNKSNPVYLSLLFFLLCSLFSLPFIETDISIKCPGIFRPSFERTELKPIITGIIDTILYREGELVQQDSTVIRLIDNHSHSKRILNDFESTQRQQFIHDLEFLTDTGFISKGNSANLLSPVYREQMYRFQFQKADLEASLKKTSYELKLGNELAAQKIIAPKELFDRKIENNKIIATYNSFKKEQLTLWQQELVKYCLELAQLKAQKLDLEEESKRYEIRAPISGTIQGIKSKYAGGIVQEGETICMISPETNLVAECFVSATEAGLISKNQQVKFQVDAFDFNYFGMLRGRVLTIDNDFTLINNRPVFKIQCTVDTTELSLKNGFRSNLKKGLTFNARFLIAHRSLWQLLFDNMDDWLNPASNKFSL